MGQVISLIKGRAKLRCNLPKPVECKDCGEYVETARLQLVNTKRCISCASARERRHAKELASMRPNDIAIIRSR